MVKEGRSLDKDHFKHVLDCLFKPSIKKCNFIPIPPIAKGSDLIHAEIIKNIEESELVLCDMSCLNPNVFFELGIRTSLNKPVCIVKDEYTKEIPFDTGIINYHEYKSSLEPWELDEEISKLSEHIIESIKRSDNQNTLWKYLGIKSKAIPYESNNMKEDKIDYLVNQVDSLRRSIDYKNLKIKEQRIDRIERNERLIELIKKRLPFNNQPTEYQIDLNQIHVALKYNLSGELKDDLIECIFHANPDSDSTGKRIRIPPQSG